MTSVPGNPQPQPREELEALKRAIEQAPKVLSPSIAMAAIHFLRDRAHAVAIVADPYVDGRKVNLLGGTVQVAKDAGELAAEILAIRVPAQRSYTPCRYVLIEGEGGGCIANATTDDGYCKPHADALREIEKEKQQ